MFTGIVEEVGESDGVVETVAAPGSSGFEVSVIPDKWSAARLGTYEFGTEVDVEVGVVAESVERLLSGRAMASSQAATT